MSANADQDARQERVGRDQKLKGVEACRDGGGVLSVGRLLRLERVQESIRELLGPDEEK